MTRTRLRLIFTAVYVLFFLWAAVEPSYTPQQRGDAGFLFLFMIVGTWMPGMNAEFDNLIRKCREAKEYWRQRRSAGESRLRVLFWPQPNRQPRA
jgi:hypothetical protein